MVESNHPASNPSPVHSSSDEFITVETDSPPENEIAIQKVAENALQRAAKDFKNEMLEDSDSERALDRRAIALALDYHLQLAPEQPEKNSDPDVVAYKIDAAFAPSETAPENVKVDATPPKLP